MIGASGKLSHELIKGVLQHESSAGLGKEAVSALVDAQDDIKAKGGDPGQQACKTWQHDTMGPVPERVLLRTSTGPL